MQFALLNRAEIAADDQKLVDSLSASNWLLHWVGLMPPPTGHSLLSLMSTMGTVVYSFVVSLL